MRGEEAKCKQKNIPVHLDKKPNSFSAFLKNHAKIKLNKEFLYGKPWEVVEIGRRKSLFLWPAFVLGVGKWRGWRKTFSLLLLILLPFPCSSCGLNCSSSSSSSSSFFPLNFCSLEARGKRQVVGKSLFALLHCCL